jgi:hypothetical protein
MLSTPYKGVPRNAKDISDLIQVRCRKKKGRTLVRPRSIIRVRRALPVAAEAVAAEPGTCSSQGSPTHPDRSASPAAAAAVVVAVAVAVVERLYPRS